MSSSDSSAKIIPLRHANQFNPEAPFRKYRRSGLVNTRFGIDGSEPLFWGYHDPARRWNGWATPTFCREVTSLIADWVNQAEPDTAWWEGSVLCLRGGDRSYVDRLEPDELGLYGFDGWVWLEANTDA